MNTQSRFFTRLVAGTMLAMHLVIANQVQQAVAQEQSPTAPDRIRLDNGVTLVLAPYPQAATVAVEVLYSVGFCDEPSGMTQVAHLMEHLLLNGATKSFGPGEVYNRLRAQGMASGETLPTLTHFDYSAPPGQLSTIIKAEAERLNSLGFTTRLISEEAEKCNDEADFVYKTPSSGMVKHAFMAFFQFWNHGATEVRVRSRLDQIPIEKVEAFHRDQYRPDQFTMVIVGKFDKAEAIALAKEHLGPIPGKEAKPKALNWQKLPERSHVTWDADVHAICVFLPPPVEQDARGLLSLWGMTLMQQLASRADLKTITHMTFSSNTTWPVGELPLFVYATAKTAEQVSQVEQALKSALRDAAREPAAQINSMRLFARHSGAAAPTWDALRDQAAGLEKNSGLFEDEMMPTLLLNVALQFGLRELNGPPPAEDAITEQRLRAVLEKTIDPAQMRVITLGPPRPREP